MIVYTKLWETLKDRGSSQYKLIRQYGISAGRLISFWDSYRSRPTS